MISNARQNPEQQPEVTPPPADDHIAPAPRVSVQAFCDTVETAAAVQSAGEDRRLGKAHLKIQMGGMAAAAEAYRSAPTPNVIILEAEERGDILAGLDQLASVCDAGTRVIVIGRVNDVTLYR
ncbi:MAG: CtpF protein, partial [Bradyrhizobium sp.]